jgi:integrase/recombinase XerD
MPDVPAVFAAAIVAYGEWMETHHYQPGTMRSRLRGVELFAIWCAEQGIATMAAVAFEHCEQYAGHLDQRRRQGNDGQRLARTTRVNLLGDVREFFRFAARHGYAAGNPAADVDGPLPEAASPPRSALTVAEMERVLAVPDVTTPMGIRDRAIIETLYSTGIRAAELTRLAPGCVYADGMLRVNDGKGRKDRVVPLGSRALGWIGRYRVEVRPGLDPERDAVELFLAEGGKKLTERMLETVVTGCMRTAGIATGSCHSIRHTCATVLLEGGADLGSVQRILGHSRMSTTSGYTHPSAAAIRDAWAKTHPAATDRDAGAVPVAPRLSLPGGATRQPTAWWWLRRWRQQSCKG